MKHRFFLEGVDVFKRPDCWRYRRQICSGVKENRPRRWSEFPLWNGKKKRRDPKRSVVWQRSKNVSLPCPTLRPGFNPIPKSGNREREAREKKRERERGVGRKKQRGREGSRKGICFCARSLEIEGRLLREGIVMATPGERSRRQLRRAGTTKLLGKKKKRKKKVRSRALHFDIKM